MSTDVGPRGVNATADGSPSRFGDLVTTNAAQLLGLTGLAIAQPLLDLFGRNPTYFVAAGLSGGGIVALAVLVTFGLPFVLFGAELVVYRLWPRAGQPLHLALMGVLGAALGAGIARHLAPQSDVVSIGLAVLVAAGVVVGLRRAPAVALGLRYLALAPLVVLGAFLFTSESSTLVFGGEAEAAGGVEVGNPAPIVMLQLDELPVASLLRRDGSINAAMFPNFARLAEGSTWYRHATSVSSGTNRSVPSIASGIMPESEVPTSASYPDNLFTLLGASYDLDVHESVTRLCPSSLCGRAAPAGGNGQVADAVADSALVLGHVVLPPFLRSSLARVDQSWGDFFGREDVRSAAPTDVSSVGTAPTTAPADALADENDADPQAQGALVDRWIGRFSDRDESTLSYIHALLPHSPWLMTREGVPLTEPGPLPGSDQDGRWSTDPVLVREGLRLHLLQLQYTDTLVGHMIDRLEALGTWDDALVVVVADHGEAFTPGEAGRNPVAGTVGEIFNVPLFIKYPGQDGGVVSDDNALTIDVLPTIVDALDIETDWSFDGQSLLDPGAHRTDKPVASNEPVAPSGFDATLAAVARNHDWLPGLDDAAGLAAVAPYTDLVGRPVDEIEVRGDVPNGWQTFEPVEAYTAGSGTIPLVQVGTLFDVTGPPPEAGLFVVNGRVAGVALAFSCEGTQCGFRGLIDEAALAPSGNRMELLLAVDGAPESFVRATYVPMENG